MTFVLTGSAMHLWGEKVAHEWPIPWAKVQGHAFPNKEWEFSVPDCPASSIFIQNFDRNIHDRLAETLLVLPQLERPVGCFPYGCYMRQGTAFAHCLQAFAAMGIESLVLVDPHIFDDFKGWNLFPIHVLDTSIVFAQSLKSRPQKAPIILSPDQGSAKRAYTLAHALRLKHAIDSSVLVCEKSRSQGSVHIRLPRVEPGALCWIRDDMIDSGRTLFCLARQLKEARAQRIEAFVTHASLRDREAFLHELSDSALDQLTVTDSLDHGLREHPKVREVSIVPAVIELLKTITGAEQKSQQKHH